jgi:DNA-binding MurR/RpiR family transcriptional regulator
MVSSAISNIEDTFANIDVDMLKQAAETIWTARRVFTLGVGVNSSNASNFTYLASTGMVEFYAIPKPGSVATDDLAWADSRDVLIAITCKPYRREVVEAVRIAREQGVKVIGVSDSAASPVIIGADLGFVVSADTPQFFPSSPSRSAGESLFCIRGRDGEIRTFYNVCQHRAHQLVSGEGNTRRRLPLPRLDL